MERLLTISIRKYLSKQPRTKRIRKTAKYVKDRVSHYIKIPLENVKIDDSLNRAIVKYYAMKMLPLRLKVDINNNIAT
jgi:ribosomal protein L31E